MLHLSYLCLMNITKTSHNSTTFHLQFLLFGNFLCIFFVQETTPSPLKTYEENKYVNLYDPGLGNFVFLCLDMTPKVQATGEKIEKRNFTQIKTFSSKDSLRKKKKWK